MNKPMRRFKQALPKTECEAVLQRGTSGVLALNGDDGYPYAVPLSYVYMEGSIVFHCAKVGYKIDCIRRSAKASFCVIDQDHVIPERYTTHFRSVIAFGQVREVSEPAEMRRLVGALAGKYRPGYEAEREKAIDAEFAGLHMLVMDIESMSGKESRELAEQRGAAKA